MDKQIADIRERCEAALAYEGGTIGEALQVYHNSVHDIPHLLGLIESLQDKLAESQRRERVAVMGINYMCGYRSDAFIKPTKCAICKHMPKGKKCPRKCSEHIPTGDNLWEWRGVDD